MNQFVVYLLVGVTSAVIDVGLMKILGLLGVHFMLAANAGFLAGLAANFLLHSRLTFRTGYSHATFVRYLGVVFANYLLTMLCVSAFHYWLDMPVLGKVLSLPLVAVNGFYLSKHWIYK
ncbi:GtrA family protein [Pseudoduganella violaceinigra]|uniref:GtrA family protein n=1 Tax=Pseudoduganella violaceinigra TaxID=246602 RepID=UPI001E4F8F39|nr:GtrA family protein [Pseudoduganella violaceinigra]